MPAVASRRDVEDAEGDEEQEEWPLWKLVLLAVPQFGVQLLWCFIGPNSAPYMMHLGVGPALATLNNVAGPTTGFFVGPIVGAFSDGLTSKFGRRRPVILCGLLSTIIAGMLFTGSEFLFTSPTLKIAFAVPMYWCLDITINILQTPHRALVADLASKEQQEALQVVFVVVMSVGNFAAYSVMQIYEVPAEHMFQLMMLIIGVNICCIALQFSIAREKPLPKSKRAAGGCCAGITGICSSVSGMPSLLYHLAAVQCLVWMGSTAWAYYGGQWLGTAVYEGDQTAPKGTTARVNYELGMNAFTLGGKLRSGVQLVVALIIIGILLKTSVRPRYVYAPTIFAGALASFLAAYAVGHDGTFAMFCWIFSILPELGSFAIPFGLVATINERAEREGKKVSTALQMSLLNSCVTVGQESCHLVLSSIEGRMSLGDALPRVFMLASCTYVLAGGLTLCLDDRKDADDDETSSSSSSDEGPTQRLTS